ncbi:BREX-1 system phosphatase PglZ type A [Rhodococcus sp. BP-252]|uniref:BREX-1 system phosphatase PglZ type A n=1 Tax=unclassified Rhodococcus (in: high G+C Gram-positive bacteria) TaxID=192944 RepID=UPI001C9AB9C0|nr:MULTISPECIES: BREX-1 system phosphatase PglZ type A [unclassified Rhodococcus (in: high G+C Gram-positive bacteria)]MBY6414298.1 BREX-1 system phosphatase PglZ type A [Rhodococcus sp. BP-320]MBY6419049.1 BREX-1 system phosphatase PglZ type A [Rhodococcus sp. BP-321]MBY6423765.1 BREX-1 system phosphatase PglZ type A [Rhodococcus sp. BP-324]MBY6429083.1 BREX-1 system phosphatase PglZ type A [Rhodococcus sp. BP-323]MBY6434089.1 BREX-1 system phosphatase PglZ type A [Rhodococcus sp. BP-322]
MSAASSARIAELLAARYAETPLLTWRDIDGDYAPHLDAIAEAVAEHGLGLTVHRVNGNELGVKHGVYTTLDANSSESARHLVYRTGEPPELRENWLLDLEVGYGTFSADTTAILVEDLGLANRGVDAVVAAHLAVFGDQRRTDHIREQLADLPSDLSMDKLSDVFRALMSAAVLGLDGPGGHRLHRIVEELLGDHVADRSDGYDALETYGLTDYLWAGCRGIYGYDADEPSVAGLATWLFDQAWRGWPEARNPARIDFERLRDDRQLRRLFTDLAERAQADLNIGERLRGHPPTVDTLTARDVFPIVDDAVLHALAAATLDRGLSPDRIAELIRVRSTTTWYDEQKHAYQALTAASECLSRIETFAPVIADPADGVRSYADNWSAIDGAYRRFRHHLGRAETDLPVELASRVEHRYVHDFQRPLAHAWQQQVDALDAWDIPGVERLAGFARYDLPAKAKTLVVVSDALRYEVGAELAARMNSDDWFSAVIEPRLSPLPSFTQLGMASMLPHTRLEMREDGTVRADGVATSGLSARDALWGCVNAAAVDYATVMSMSATDRAALWSDHDAVVVYHDAIDAVGHKSPYQTPEACDRAIDEIIRVIKRFGGKTRASRVLVTADHGFLYQDSDLEPGDYLSEAAHGDEIVARTRRYVLGRGLLEHPAFTTWTAAQLGHDGDLQVQVPRALHRIRMQGAGYQYVHGGATLQEVVVPLITLTQSRSKDTSKVTVDVNVSSPTITSSTVLVTLLQREVVTGKRRARTLVIGVYAEDGTALSGERTVAVDSAADDVRDRSLTVELVLNEAAERFNGKSVYIRAEEITNGTRTEYRHTTAALQRGFGGFFDPL